MPKHRNCGLPSLGIPLRQVSFMISWPEHTGCASARSEVPCVRDSGHRMSVTTSLLTNFLGASF